MKPKKPKLYNPKLVILWDNEIKQAVKTLKNVRDFYNDNKDNDNINDRDWTDVVMEAIKACNAALYHPALLEENSAITVMVASNLKELEEDENDKNM
ncbi:hypothetical protein A2Z67_03785 [Candidatus Woesebacteria bacterium RBG_13_36_22]|uniref:Uncharacterized protein n=1 Tax=Candidatus Woesebacteria bacterium RBG_13_36_22 TaxID=1802478 RepID=A0A1F7X3Z0_9BACT|nr:MAG: hypothetical protein A2Z67_03785 [Candidatus Woesebacteria bacterium RBG_13_36_22]